MMKVPGCIIKFAFNRPAKVKDVLNIHEVNQLTHSYYMHWMMKVPGCIIKFAFNRPAKVKDVLNIHEVNQLTHSY